MIAYLITRFVFSHGIRQKQYIHRNNSGVVIWVFEISKATRFKKYDEAADVATNYMGDLELAPQE